MNIVTVKTLGRAAKNRAHGYLAAVLAVATPLDGGRVSLTDEQWDELSDKFRVPRGIGTALQSGIHAIVDAAPLPKKMKNRIKGCPGCRSRVKWLDRSRISKYLNLNPK